MSSASAWDAYYAGVEHPFCTATATALTSRTDRLPPGRAIDLGCGLGRHARHLAESGWSVQAVDFSRVAIEIATAADGPDVTYLVGDVTRWRPAEPADLILVSFLHPRAEELFALLGAARTWLAPGGHLLYLGHAHHVAVDGDGPHGDFPDLADLARACEGMRIDEMAHIVRPHIDTTTVDVLLHARSWCSQNTALSPAGADFGALSREPSRAASPAHPRMRVTCAGRSSSSNR
ncbi:MULTISPECIES: trans-aconitate 2-methyltransferase [Mycobacteriaceae]|uniref:Class I SAM-dependent methyltransferase n=1 Tax=Mycolicibacterium hodleri TaxID=49897 RepID=A0A544W6X2_9MYCO|nr:MULTISPECIES: class I SAM-dependent methyltransferase [Mycobacteriaceae]OPX08272.1 SAM-dependent methyltransferase [Mycobacterium sp. AT1]TQR87993.1 class I SAM-dependent methyltransferase [Mycolicibacterium hodleri]